MKIMEVLTNNFGRLSKRVGALNRLLNSKDLPAVGWKLKSEHSWRNGAFGRVVAGEIAERAIQTREYSSSRSFVLPNSSLGLIIHVLPYASASDAESSVPTSTSEFAKNRKFEGQRIREEKISDLMVAGFDTTSVFETQVLIEEDVTRNWHVCGSVGKFVVTVVCSSSDERFNLDDVKEIAELQAKKIRLSEGITNSP